MLQGAKNLRRVRVYKVTCRVVPKLPPLEERTDEYTLAYFHKFVSGPKHPFAVIEFEDGEVGYINARYIQFEK